MEPTHEMILVARKPLEGTVAENVQEHGTGGINIDGCRVTMKDNLDGGGYSKGESKGMWTPGEDGGGLGRLPGQFEQPSGRWPPNLVMVHHPECVQVGTKKVKGYAINRWTDGAKPFGGGAGHEYEGEQMPDEEVTVWDCHPACHVRQMNEQSGELGKSSGGGMKRSGENNLVYGKASGHPKVQNVGFGDTSGASRFFPCFAYGDEKKNEADGDRNMAKTTYDLRLGDCLEEMKKMPDASVEAVITDPPYGLSTHTPADVAEALTAWLKGEPYLHGSVRKGRKHCAVNILDNFISDSNNLDSKTGEDFVPFDVFFSLPSSRMMLPVNFDNEIFAGKKEVNGDGAIPEIENVLMDKVYSKLQQLCGNGNFTLRKRKGFTGCVGECTCFSKFGDSLFRIPIRFCDDTFTESERSSDIVTFLRAELAPVLTLDVRGRTGELSLTNRATEFDCGFELVRSECVGTLSGAGGLPSISKSSAVSGVSSSADRTCSFYFFAHKELLERFDNPIIPQGGMMGKSWDAFVPGPEVWKEAYRVLKPGGHLLCFAGSRTSDLMGIAIRMAGFEIRDSILTLHWVYGCLSDDTEILVDGRWEPYHKAIAGRHALCYDVQHDSYSWQPIENLFVYDYDDTAFRIVSDSTDQVVSRNHRCIVEQEGAKVFRVAEEVAREQEARVPILEGLSDLLHGLSLSNKRTGGQQSGSQTVRGTWYTRTDLARVEPIHYKGLVWCVKVPTGAFVARRNGKVFVTGNSGFPKSMDISKAIDKAAGKEREVVGTNPNTKGRTIRRSGGIMNTIEGVEDRGNPYLTAPATDAAKKWAGWGTALKPAHEPILIARKPVEGTVAENVQEHGTGGINVDGCRVPGTWNRSTTTRCDIRGGKTVRGKSDGIECEPQSAHLKGRWPPNLIMIHHPECVNMGTKKIASSNKSTGGGRRKGGDAYGKYKGNEEPVPVGYADSEGTETVENWVCHPLCPVRQMDEQSGDLIPCGGAKKTTHNSGMFGIGTPGYVYTDDGGASRFFPAFHYCAKASRLERDAGCEHLPKKTGGEMVDRVDGSPGTQSPRAGAGRLSGAYNYHPTVKPVDLLRWLVKLVCRKGGTILDPFMGSGTTGLACYHEECNFIGIEIDEGYYTLAEARNKHVRQQMRLF